MNLKQKKNKKRMIRIKVASEYRLMTRDVSTAAGRTYQEASVVASLLREVTLHLALQRGAALAAQGSRWR